MNSTSVVGIKQSQFAAGGTGIGIGIGRRGCGLLYKQTQFVATPRGTRPGRRGPRALRRPSSLWPAALPGPIVPNKPNWQGPSVRVRDMLCKQTQFRECRAGAGGRLCETNPIPPQWRTRQTPRWERTYGKLDMHKAPAKQSQFPRGQQWTRCDRTACSAGGTYRAKQSQSTFEVPGVKGTEWTRGERVSPRLESQEAAAPNEANFPRAGRNGPEPVRSPMPLPLGQNVRNKANSRRAA